MTWTSPAPRLPGDWPGGDERSVVQGFLDVQRRTLLNVCAGLTGEQLAARPLPSSELSLLGLVRHLAKVERVWLRERAAGEDVPTLHGGAGDPSDFRDVQAGRAAEEVEQLQREWELGDAAVARLPYDAPVRAREDVLTLRVVHVHLLSDYARHNGHADLLREALDGVRGR